MGGSDGDPKEGVRGGEEAMEVMDVEKAGDQSKWDEQQRTGNRCVV